MSPTAVGISSPFRHSSANHRPCGHGRRTRPTPAKWPQNAGIVAGPLPGPITPSAPWSAAGDARPLTRGHLAASQHIPLKFLSNILQELKTAGLVSTHLGSEGGYGLARPADHITLADVIRAVDGPLANVRGAAPESVVYAGTAEPLRDVWIAVRASLRSVLEHVTLADVARDQLPQVVRTLAADPLAWQPHAHERR